MQTLEERLDAMSLKDFKQFQNQIEKYAKTKVSKYFRNLFKGYIRQLGIVKNESDDAFIGYLDRCNFSNDTKLSKLLDIEDPLHDFSVRYDEIRFSHVDHLGSYTLSGDPNNPKIDLPRDWNNGTLGSGEGPKYLELSDTMKFLALLHWNCYRAYIDSNPDDDRDLSSDEEAEQEEWDELREQLKNESLSNEKYDKMRADADRHAQDSVESWKIEQEAIAAKIKNEHTNRMQDIRNRLLESRKEHAERLEKIREQTVKNQEEHAQFMEKMDELTEKRKQINESNDPKVNRVKAISELILGYKALIKERVNEYKSAKETMSNEEYEAKLEKMKEHYAHLTDFIEASKVERSLAQEALGLSKTIADVPE